MKDTEITNLSNTKKKGFEKSNFSFSDNIQSDYLQNNTFKKIVNLKDNLDNFNLSLKEKKIIETIYHSYEKLLKNIKLDSRDMVLIQHELLELDKLNPEYFPRYLIYRYKYNKYSELKILDDYPPCIQIEPTSICNFRCVMCYQIDKSFSSKSNGFMGYMNFDIFKKVIDEVEGNLEAVTFASRGEPTLSKDLEKMLKYCENKFLALKLNTNASLLNEKLIHSLLSSDLQTIVFSIDEKNKENYEKIRVNSKFEKILKNLELFNKIRNTHYKKDKKIVRITGVKINKKQNLEEMKNQWKDFADIIAFTNYSPWESSYENKINDIITACSELFQRIFVWWDGKVNPCDYDYKSILSKWNVKQKTIKEIWNSDYYNLIRKRHLEKQRSMIEPCKRCPIT
jgi:radical SAM protein with 4Fe4S-binding SPASM domain|tara:strand:+ start:52 stop:1242 length:1191 start_codon:yes stop_codon:yes gene_type:complete